MPRACASPGSHPIGRCQRLGGGTTTNVAKRPRGGLPYIEIRIVQRGAQCFDGNARMIRTTRKRPGSHLPYTGIPITAQRPRKRVRGYLLIGVLVQSPGSNATDFGVGIGCEKLRQQYRALVGVTLRCLLVVEEADEGFRTDLGTGTDRLLYGVADCLLRLLTQNRRSLRRCLRGLLRCFCVLRGGCRFALEGFFHLLLETRIRIRLRVFVILVS